MNYLEKNQLYTTRADGYTAEGAGVFHIEGRAVFVPGVLDGELWQVRIVKVTSSVVYGKGEELLEPSPERIEPDCGAYPRCGGCALRHMSYKEECDMKLRRVNDALQRIGGLELAAERIFPAGPDAASGNMMESAIRPAHMTVITLSRVFPLFLS